MKKLVLSLLISATIAVVASFLFLGWYRPQFLFALFLGVFGIAWVWFLSRVLKTGVITVKGLRYLREKSPFAYWSWLGFFFVVGVYVLSAGTYALVFLRF